MKKLTISRLLLAVAFCMSGAAMAQTTSSPGQSGTDATTGATGSAYPNASGTLNGNTVENQTSSASPTNTQQALKDCTNQATKDSTGKADPIDVDNCLKSKGVKSSSYKSIRPGSDPGTTAN